MSGEKSVSKPNTIANPDGAERTPRRHWTWILCSKPISVDSWYVMHLYSYNNMWCRVRAKCVWHFVVSLTCHHKRTKHFGLMAKWYRSCWIRIMSATLKSTLYGRIFLIANTKFRIDKGVERGFINIYRDWSRLAN